MHIEPHHTAGERVVGWLGRRARSPSRGPSGASALTTHPGGNLHVLTAVCSATGAAEGLVSPTLNAEGVQLFLDQLSSPQTYAGFTRTTFLPRRSISPAVTVTVAFQSAGLVRSGP